MSTVEWHKAKLGKTVGMSSLYPVCLSMPPYRCLYIDIDPSIDSRSSTLLHFVSNFIFHCSFSPQSLKRFERKPRPNFSEKEALRKARIH